jgi:hypothetical protein
MAPNSEVQVRESCPLVRSVSARSHEYGVLALTYEVATVVTVWVVQRAALSGYYYL